MIRKSKLSGGLFKDTQRYKLCKGRFPRGGASHQDGMSHLSNTSHPAFTQEKYPT